MNMAHYSTGPECDAKAASLLQRTHHQAKGTGDCERCCLPKLDPVHHHDWVGTAGEQRCRRDCEADIPESKTTELMSDVAATFGLTWP